MLNMLQSSMASSQALVCQRSFCTGSVTPSHLHRSPTRTQQRRQQAGRVRAEGEFRVPKPPKGVTLPNMTPEVPPSSFGFVEAAERLNSRAAMIGFFGILLVEAIAGKGIFEMVGISVGNGLGFEF